MEKRFELTIEKMKIMADEEFLYLNWSENGCLKIAFEDIINAIKYLHNKFTTKE